MNATYFDTLAYAKKLQEAGISKVEAEAHAEALASVTIDSLATKADIQALGSDTKNDNLTLSRDIADLRKDFTTGLTTLKKDLLLQLGTLIVVGFGVLGTILKLLQS
jgi:hypothetical protein